VKNEVDERQEEKNRYAEDYCVFGLCPSSGILKTREHNFSETESVSVLR
jgi:hypothetical protein